MDFQTDYYLNKVSILNGLFLIVFGSILFNVNQKNMVSIDSIKKPNRLFFYISVILFFICAHFGMSGDTILTSGYGASERSKTSLFEYSIVFFLLALFFSNDYKSTKLLLWAMVIYFSLKCLLYGGRIEVIQIVLAFLYAQTNFFRTWSLKKLYSCLFIAVIFLIIIARIRINPLLIFTLFEAPMVLFNFSPISKTGIVSSNYGDVLQASARMIGLVDTGIWNLEFRIRSFISYVFNIFFFGTEFKDEANLALRDQQTYGVGGGGLIAAQFYVWLDWLGPILSGVFVGGIIRKGLRLNAHKTLFIYVFTLLVTFPRWYAYGPLALVKIAVITTVFYILFCNISFLLKEIKH